MAEKNTTQKELTCICCPVGCALTVTIADDSSVTVTGNRCPRGAAYGEKEVTNPTRIVTSTVRVTGYPDAVVSVKTASDIPKGRIDDCMKALADVTVAAPIHVGGTSWKMWRHRCQYSGNPVVSGITEDII